MTGCYHDKHDFKSDLDIEVAREGDILEDGQDLDEIECDKNPGHRGFIPFKDLILDHLPTAFRHKETLDGIKKIGSIVVRIIVPDRGIGSGYVGKMLRHSMFYIQTNNHVVNTDDDVRRCTVEFHYDSKDRSSVVTSKGVGLINTCPDRDITNFLFYPIPDFLYQLDWNDFNVYSPSTVIMYNNNAFVTRETLAVYNQSQSYASIVNLNSLLIDVMFLSWSNGSISYIHSPYFRFKPMNNINELPSIEIHIDDDDGKSKVISGGVVKFGDEFVVKVSGSIFQDEVKKCRLVWNGEVIGCGTRLYFEPIKPSKLFDGFSEIDIALVMQNYSQENFWVFGCDKPKPKDIEEQLNTIVPLDMCCIGHPHGGIKMVTFGYGLMFSRNRFDHLCRRIDKPDKHCQCKLIGCYNYSCKTCRGSSGSPVFPLLKKPKLSFNLTHFMGKSQKALVSNGEQIDNINSAWFPSPK